MADINDLKDICISSGTLRAEDLLPRFMGILKDYAPEKFNEFIKGYPELDGWEDFLEADWRIISDDTKMNASDDLFGLLNDIAPEGTMFSSTEGDGADFGFWTVEEKLLDDDEGEKALKQMAKGGKSTGEVAADIRYDVATALDMAADKAEDLMTKFGLDKIYVLRAQGLSPKAIAKKILKACESKDEGWLGGFYSRQDVLDAMDGGILNKDWKLEKRFGNWGCYVNQDTGRPLVLQVMVSQDRNGDWGYKPVTSDMGPVDTNIQAAKWLKPRLEEWVEKNPDLAKDVPDYEWGWIEKCLGKETANKDRKNLVSSLVKGDKIKLIDTVADGAVVTFIDMITPTKMRILHNGREMSCKTSFIDRKVEESKSEAKKYYGYGKDNAIDKEDNDFMWQVAYDWFVDKLPEKLAQYADKAVIDVIDKDSRAYEEIVTMDDYYDYLETYGPAVIEDIKANDESKQTEGLPPKKLGNRLYRSRADLINKMKTLDAVEITTPAQFNDIHSKQWLHTAGYAMDINGNLVGQTYFGDKDGKWYYATTKTFQGDYLPECKKSESKSDGERAVDDYDTLIDGLEAFGFEPSSAVRNGMFYPYRTRFTATKDGVKYGFTLNEDSTGEYLESIEVIGGIFDKGDPNDPDATKFNSVGDLLDALKKMDGKESESKKKENLTDKEEHEWYRFWFDDVKKHIVPGKSGYVEHNCKMLPHSDVRQMWGVAAMAKELCDNFRRYLSYRGYTNSKGSPFAEISWRAEDAGDLLTAMNKADGSSSESKKTESSGATLASIYGDGDVSTHENSADGFYVNEHDPMGFAVLNDDTATMEELFSGKAVAPEKPWTYAGWHEDTDAPENKDGSYPYVYDWEREYDLNFVNDWKRVVGDKNNEKALELLLQYAPDFIPSAMDFWNAFHAGYSKGLLRKLFDNIFAVVDKDDPYNNYLGYGDYTYDEVAKFLEGKGESKNEDLNTAKDFVSSIAPVAILVRQASQPGFKGVKNSDDHIIVGFMRHDNTRFIIDWDADKKQGTATRQVPVDDKDALYGYKWVTPKSNANVTFTTRAELKDFVEDTWDNTSSESKNESLTLKQKELKDMARYGEAEDITTISDAEAKELKKKGIETVGVSRGTYGMNGALLRDRDGNKYVITARSSNLFYFV